MKNKKENFIIVFWNFLKKDSWSSWIVSIILMIILIKFVLFPTMAFLTGSKLPVVIVESCSMYHDESFDEWWDKNGMWYEQKNISKKEFSGYPLKNGLNKGDIVVVIGKKEYKKGDIIIFEASSKYPIIHRIVSKEPIGTKGDNNQNQIVPNGLTRIDETNISKEKIIGKAVFRIPYLGWIKLIFFDLFGNPTKRGFC